MITVKLLITKYYACVFSVKPIMISIPGVYMK